MADYTTYKIAKAGSWEGAFELCILTYDERFIRRKVLNTVHGGSLLVDLPSATSLGDRDAFVLTDGRQIEIIAAEEDLYEIRGDLTRLAWHIGNRHMPCQIEEKRLLIQRDHVIRDMLSKLGAELHEIREPFTPEGGAYGHGRTHAHAH
ncbi:urease accessory protein [Aliiroseovarius halocynthiae]|uniref:Urease accessory protein UreE n=1 Tax=Aliiroseovarius halocynthiae TaxID=985055 RepID=A0A545SUJ4_9RHOB|nr:urease accessory protein UreE [Aliiroseovarius halocynthiae]TQV68623.1 urease accessory protein UreE [Aliiroseovarius halocynthiae]SMR71039.1 urease accessory protein [Aliiroseovarius halocynthiae]